MTRRLRTPCLLAAGLFLGACGVPTQSQGQRVDDDAVPFALLDRDVPPLLPPTAGSTARAPICFVQGDHLVVVATPMGAMTDLPAVLDALLEPPGDSEPALRTAVGAPRVTGGVKLAGGVAQVDLLPSITDLGGNEQLLAVAQIVCTLTGQPGVGLVSFTLNGAPLAVPRGDGTLTREPASRDDYASLLS